ncbi:SGNH hydrolase [Biscogniauxia mediterranea]|nr:SGNH hydrolase [Biscogniauxia mediterranea]
MPPPPPPPPPSSSTQTQTQTQTQTLRILCFGNSLTCGYPEGRPYAGKLKERLEEELNSSSSSSSSTSTSNSNSNNGGSSSSSTKARGGGGGRERERERERGREGEKKIVVECVVDGVPGDLVVNGGFIERLERRCFPGANDSYDWTIVLGGTNDLGWDIAEELIIEGLKKAWDIPLSCGGKVLALTIPDTKFAGGNLPERRAKVNAAIKAYKKTNFFHFDLATAIPYHAATAADRDAHWSEDGVHMTAAGYDALGCRVAEALARVVRLAEAQDTDISSVVADARQRRAIEELIFEEERGDPRLLSQGYIVVRRRDLD